MSRKSSPPDRIRAHRGIPHSPEIPEAVRNAFLKREPGQLMGPGHPVGDFLEAPGWQLLEEREGYLRVRARVAEAVKNLRGELFGGFTPTYVDLIALCTHRAGHERRFGGGWLATLNMRIDYFEPIRDTFTMESQVVRRRGANAWIETRFTAADGTLLAFAFTTLRETGGQQPGD